MARYIELDALVAEIERHISAIDNCPKFTDTQIVVLEGNKVVLIKLLSFLDTIEVKEVDLEKEINKYISNNFFGSQTMGFFAARTKEEHNDIDMALCAKHFFELGMAVSNKAQKGE